MTTPREPAPSPKSATVWRRIAGSAIIGVLFFAILWYTVFSAITAALISSGTTVVLVAAASWSEIFEQILETIAAIFAAILSAIAAFFSGLFGLFGS
jgi:hypothetical protein